MRLKNYKPVDYSTIIPQEVLFIKPSEVNVCKRNTLFKYNDKFVRAEYNKIEDTVDYDVYDSQTLSSIDGGVVDMTYDEKSLKINELASYALNLDPRTIDENKISLYDYDEFISIIENNSIS